MNTYDLSGRCAVVTGGAQGIGAAIVARLLSSGAMVASWDLQGTAPDGATSIECDVANWASVQSALDQTEARVGPVDILVNSAGISGPNMPVADYDVGAWAQIIQVNLTGTFHVNKAVVAGMQQRNYGRIVNIASIAGKEGNPNACAYSASKAGVIGFTKSLGKELAGHDIAVCCITPAAARTPIFDQMTDAHIDYMLSKIPRARFLEVEEAANMVTWLVSSENSFSTAAVFDLSGGRATY
jgi:NAD(P)-dependent dehydrogenase (short-subunit alcohol dehydrogenase family)